VNKSQATVTSLQVISFNPKSVSTTFNDNSPLDILDVPIYDSTKNQYVFKHGYGKK
jgi:hypothetical protein